MLAASPAMALPASLLNKAKVAFADIEKARTALDAGNTKTSSGLLGRAQTLLQTVLAKAPGGNLVSEAQKLDPSLAQQTSRTGLGGLVNAYDNVKAARSLLGSGEVQKAKGLLDSIPSLSSLKLP